METRLTITAYTDPPERCCAYSQEDLVIVHNEEVSELYVRLQLPFKELYVLKSDLQKVISRLG